MPLHAQKEIAVATTDIEELSRPLVPVDLVYLGCEAADTLVNLSALASQSPVEQRIGIGERAAPPAEIRAGRHAQCAALGASDYIVLLRGAEQRIPDQPHRPLQ